MDVSETSFYESSIAPPAQARISFRWKST